MFVLGDAYRERILRMMACRNQGWETMTTLQLLEELRQENPQAFRDLLSSIFSASPDSDRHGPERLTRSEMIRAARAADNVDFQGDSDIPAGKTFETFTRRDNPSVTQALDAAQDWARGRAPYLLTLSGAPGVGKTHLALAAAHDVMGRDQPIIYRTEKRVLDDLHQAMRKGEDGPAEVMEELGTIPWLVLDDLGAGATSEWDKAHMDQLVNLRWEGTTAHKRTLVTTNLVGPAMTPRMASRLGDVHVGRTILVKAADYRTQKEGR